MKCLHEPCKCEVDSGNHFCSEQCESADAAVSPECPCGHQQCRGEGAERVRHNRSG